MRTPRPDALRKSYPEYVAALSAAADCDAALRDAVGGEFLATGALEHQLLKSLGLQDGQMVIDVGCGSGRLAFQLRPYPHLRYLGTDVVPELLEYAARRVGRCDWQFVKVDEIAIPADNATADFVVFFSVFTHLTHEQTFRYLREAVRVAKPGARIVFSFLEFRLEAHWRVFAESIGATDQHLNQFLEREAIRAWAHHLGLFIEQIYDGDKPHIPLDAEIRHEDGRVMSGLGNLGQSVAVLRVRSQTAISDNARQQQSPMVVLRNRAASEPARIAATAPGFHGLSARGRVDAGSAALIVGFTCAVPTCIVVRASGQRLIAAGLVDVVPQPVITVYSADGTVIATNDGWTLLPDATRDALEHALATRHESFDHIGNDAALMLTLQPGSYSVVVTDRHGRPGLVHVDAFTF